MILLLIGLVTSLSVAAQSTIGSVNSGAISNSNLMFSVGEIFVVPSTNNDEASSGTMGIVYRTQLFEIVGIDDIVIESLDIRAFPNPTSNILTIEIVGSTAINFVNVYSVDGQLVLSKEVNNGQIDLAELMPGSYILSLGDDQARSVKIIKTN